MMSETGRYDRDFVVEQELLAEDPPRLSRDQLRAGNVLGRDDRARVSDTLIKPFRWVCQILAVSRRVGEGRKGVGTGFVIGRRSILTAAHNLLVLGHRADLFEIYLAVDGDRQASPLGQYVAYRSVSHPDYFPHEHRDYDLAVLLLDDDLPDSLLPSPARYGALKIVQADAQALDGKRALVTGYPKRVSRDERDELPASAQGVQAFQYYCLSRMRRSGNHVSYQLDTTRGQSGSPLITLHRDSLGRDQSVAAGVHIEGGTSESGNFAVPLDQERLDFVVETLHREGDRLTA